MKPNAGRPFSLLVCVLATSSADVAWASDAILPFPFKLPDGSAISASTGQLPEPSTPRAFKRRCFRFIYAAVHAVKTDTAKLPELLTSLCKDADTSRCQQWGSQLRSAVDLKEEPGHHSHGVRGLANTEEDSYVAWCAELVKPSGAVAQAQPTVTSTTKTTSTKVESRGTRSIPKPSAPQKSASSAPKRLPTGSTVATTPASKKSHDATTTASSTQPKAVLRGSVRAFAAGGATTKIADPKSDQGTVMAPVAASKAGSPKPTVPTSSSKVTSVTVISPAKEDASFSIGDEVMVYGRHAFVSRGPDGYGKFKVMYDGGAESIYILKQDLKNISKSPMKTGGETPLPSQLRNSLKKPTVPSSPSSTGDASISIGDEVMVYGRHAFVSKGPDGESKFKVKYDDGAESIYILKKDLKKISKTIVATLPSQIANFGAAGTSKTAKKSVEAAAAQQTPAKPLKEAPSGVVAPASVETPKKAKKCACFKRDGKKVCRCAGDAH